MTGDLVFRSRRVKRENPISEINRLTLERAKLLIRKNELAPNSDAAKALLGRIKGYNEKLLKFEGKNASKNR